jgi:acetyl esterase/lipase
MVAALAPFGLDTFPPTPPLRPDFPLADKLQFCAAAETGFEAFFAALMRDVPEMTTVVRTTETIRGSDGNDLHLYIHEPDSANKPLPCILHLHGGAMVMLRAAGPLYQYWRDNLAAAGMVAIGVEFRNAAGVLGSHPFPSGLEDCSSALAWVHANRRQLGLSKIIISGDSGGANLALATTLKAKREGLLSNVDGVYAMAPYIYGAYTWEPSQQTEELPSLTENDLYFVNNALSSVLASVYDPGGFNRRNPLCWPYFATEEDLTGLPPHVISVNELCPLRDEGLAYYRKLLQASVKAVGRTVHGTCHIGDCMFRTAMPEVYLATINDIRGFASIT